MDISIDLIELERINKECSKIQAKYNFKIPKYILTTLIKEDYDKVEVIYLINMAIINKRFTNEEGKLLKNDYCFK